MRFIKVIDAVHRVPGALKQFIAVYAPSLSGKTQLAISLDHYAEHPLCPHEPNSTCKNPGSLPLKICLRLPCNSAFSNSASAMQTINESPLDPKTFTEAVSSDLRILTDNSKRPIEDVVSVSSVLDTFTGNKSHTLAVFAGWIKARIDGSEFGAFRNKSSLCEITADPLNVSEFFAKCGVEPKTKPVVIVLDEFSVALQTDNTMKDRLLFLRNLLRACGVVTVLMGTNASAINMLEKGAMGRPESGAQPRLWAQVVTNIFSPLPIDQFVEINAVRECLVEPVVRFSDGLLIVKWIEEGKCIKPGVFKSLLKSLGSPSMNGSPAKIVWQALKLAGTALIDRKPCWGNFDYLLGQVEAMVSMSRFSHELNPATSVKLLNDHYASLATYNKIENLNLFAVYRKSVFNGLCLLPLAWSKIGENAISLEGTAVRSELPGNEDYIIDDYLFEGAAEAAFPIRIGPPDELFSPRTGYPTFESDEIGFLALFATEAPFVLNQKLTDIEVDPRMKFKYADLADPGQKLTTRAALTIVLRHLHGQTQHVELHTNQAARRDGFFMELVCNSAFVIASHNAGLGGSTLVTFFPRFINEISWNRRENPRLSEKSVELLGSFAEYYIPFIPMINNTCSKSLRSIPGVHTGTLKMAKDTQRVDAIGYADCLADSCPATELNRVIFTDEYKNTEEAINSNDLTGGSETDGIIDKAIGMKAILTAKLLEMRGEDGIEPAVHFHFLTVSKLTDLRSESWGKIAMDYPDLSVYVLSEITADGEIVLERKVTGRCKAIEPVHLAKKARNRLSATKARELFASYNLSTDMESLAVPVNVCPTCMIITEVEGIVSELPIRYTAPPLNTLFQKIHLN